MNKRLRAAIAKIEVKNDSGKLLSWGTGSLIAEDLVITALHVVADRRKKTLTPKPGRITLHFPDREVGATIESELWDRHLDWALLRCDTALPMRPIPLGALSDSKPDFESFGFPKANPEGLLFEGHISDTGSSYGGAPAYQLYSIQAAAGEGAPVPGLSGGPLLVDDALVGVMRSSLMQEGHRNVAGTLYACPVHLLADKTSALLPLPDPIRGLPGLPWHPLPAEPFRYLQWFGEEHAEVFFGRDAAIRRLYDHLHTDRPERVLLFYGPTGVGKSSLLAAGVIPRLTRHDQVIYARRSAKLGLLGTLQQALEGISAPDSPAAQAGESPTGGESDTDPSGDPNPDPLDAAARLRRTWMACERANDRPLMVFLDQVEEAFLRSRTSPPAELSEFLHAVAAAFPPPVERDGPEDLVRGRLVLSFRKEWLPEIEQLASGKRIPFSKMFLQPLDRPGIISACTGLLASDRLRSAYNLSIDPEVPELVANDLLQGGDAPIAPGLQILLTKLWRRARARSESAPEITVRDYQQLKAEGVLLSDFIDQQIAKLPEDLEPTRESGLVLDVLAFHTTAQDTARMRTHDEVRTTYASSAIDLPLLMQQLQDAYLLVDSVHDRRATRKATRLAHDTLAPIVRRKAAASNRPCQIASRIFEHRLGEWRDGAVGRPLDQRDLSVIESAHGAMRVWTDDEERLVAASRKRRRTWRIIWAVIATAFVAAALTLLVLYRQSERAKARAENNAHVAERAKSAAETAKEESQKNERHALRQSKFGELGRLAARSMDAADDQPRRALILALQTEQITSTASTKGFHFTDSQQALRTALSIAIQAPVAAYGDREALIASSVGPNGRWLATTSKSGTSTLTDLCAPNPGASSKPLYVSRPGAGTSNEKPIFAVSSNGKWLITDSEDSTARVWNLRDWCTRELGEEWRPVKEAHISPDGRWVVTKEGSDREAGLIATLWQTDDEASRGTQLPFYVRAGTDFIFSDDSAWLFGRRDDAPPQLWRLFPREGENPMRAEVVDFPAQPLAHAAFGRGGTYLATVERAGTVHAYRLSSRPRRARAIALASTKGAFLQADISPDGRWLFASGSESSGRLWALTGPKRHYDLYIRPGDTGTFAFSGDSRWLVTDADSGTAKLWKLTARDPRQARHILPGVDFRERLSLIAISPDSHWLVTAVANKSTFRVWDLDSDTPYTNFKEFRGHDQEITSASFVRGQTGADQAGVEAIVTTSLDRSARVWTLYPDGREPLGTRGHLREEAGSRVFELGADAGTSARLDASGQWLMTLQPRDPERGCMQKPAENGCAPCSEQGGPPKLSTLRYWPIDAGQDLAPPPVLQARDETPVHAISPDGRFLAVPGDPPYRQVRVLDTRAAPLESGEYLTTRFDERLSHLAFAENGRYLAVATRRRLRVFDLGGARPATVLDTPLDRQGIRRIAVDPQGRWLAAALERGAIALWDLRSGAGQPVSGTAEPVTTPVGSRPSNLTFAPTGDYLAMSNASNRIHIFRVTAEGLGRYIGPHAEAGGPVCHLRFSQAGHWLAGVISGRVVKIWPLGEEWTRKYKQRVIELTSDVDTINALAFAPARENVGDSHYLAIASSNHRAYFWDLGAEENRMHSPVVLVGHEGRVTSAWFSPDTNWLLTTSSQDGTVRWWPMWSSELVERACRFAGKNEYCDNHETIYMTNPLACTRNEASTPVPTPPLCQ